MELWTRLPTLGGISLIMNGNTFIYQFKRSHSPPIRPKPLIRFRKLCHNLFVLNNRNPTRTALTNRLFKSLGKRYYRPHNRIILSILFLLALYHGIGETCTPMFSKFHEEFEPDLGHKGP